MKVFLHLFASLHDLAGVRDLDIELADGATVGELKARVALAYPAVGPLLNKVAAAVNDEYVSSDERLTDGARVALIPPVSGGSAETLFRVTTDILDGQALVDLVRGDADGAVALFYGIVRNNSEGRNVERLEYEAHESMALTKLREVAAATKSAFPEVSEIGVWHRTGTLEIGETSLLVAVASPHRKDAFEACHWAVDRIKEVVPIWKKEHWAGGAAWVEGHVVEPPELAR